MYQCGRYGFDWVVFDDMKSDVKPEYKEAEEISRKPNKGIEQKFQGKKEISNKSEANKSFAKAKAKRNKKRKSR